MESKLVALCGNNAPVNIENIARTSENNIFAKLHKLVPNKNIVGVGCAAHILHNALRNACDGMGFEIEYTVVKLFTHIYIYTVRTEELKSICETSEEEYDRLLGYVVAKLASSNYVQPLTR